MKNKQILYIPGQDISIDDGSGINERNFVNTLLANEVNVLIPKPANTTILSNTTAYKNLHSTTCTISKKNPFMYLYYIYQQIGDIKRIVKENDIAIVIFRLGFFPLDILYVKKILKKRVFLKHLTFLSSSQKQNVQLKIVGVLRSLFVRKSLIDGCDTPSYMTKQYVQKYYKLNNIHIAKNGTPKIEVNRIELSKRKDYIYIGRLSNARNTPYLLESFSKSNKSIDIFGFGELEDLTIEYSKKYENINFHGKVAYNEIIKILPNYKFGIDLTYVQTEFGKASYSQKIAQYLAYGLNAIVVDCPDNMFIKENDCGVLFDPEKGDLDTLLNHIEYQRFDPLAIGKYIYADEIVQSLIQFWKK